MLLTEHQTASLVQAAQQGDRAGLEALFEAHYSGMEAVATQILGPGPDAQDACQDAAITALARIGDLRDPAAVRAWLHMIVRNNCRTRLRARRPVTLEKAHAMADPDTPDAALDRDAERDWVRHAVRRLSPAVREVAVLRYFTERNSYEQIADLCGIPVGTVRSRLSEARRQLALVLPQVRDERHEDSAAATAERREEAEAVLAAAAGGTPPDPVRRRWAAHAVVSWPDGDLTIGLGSLVSRLARDHAGGTRHRLAGVVAGPGLTVWETTVTGPDRLPATGTWMLREHEGEVQHVRLIWATDNPARSRAR
ncbi:RNA polymerase sigma factor [Paractinoplanes atraurantiacus]|uniref:RNA polymerase sigma-70 factor, ECF subfamily n=1 Tax=Paractinoplanes atraurantiacus TaxID=1036182 RepID=A0A285GRJ8_9ACTN|nr:sigma-70 family RNA polymerase sigma factor [Actinoplanes atraurantiacus]SNY26078.1 RNA polymerase sigma-70 factor, ECF subfamily [Actinoplanes atraurantiacus]